MSHDPNDLSTDRPLIIEELLLQADELSLSGAPHDQVDDLLTAARELLQPSEQEQR